MKILVHGINFAPELIGVGKYTGEMCNWLAKRGHEVKIVTAYPYYPDWSVKEPFRNGRYTRETIDGVEVTRCPLYVPKSPGGLKRILHHFSFAISSTPAIVGRARKFRPDVVFAVAPSFIALPAALQAARLSGAVAWAHIQDLELDAAFELGFLSNNTLRRAALGIEHRVLNRFDCVSSISPKMIERLADKKVDLSRLLEFPNWVDTTAIAPQDRQTRYREKLGLSAETIVALYSGNMSTKQGLEYVVEAARELAPFRRDIVFVLSGSGPMRDRLHRDVERLPNVRLLDLQPVERLSELLATADMHLLPQRVEAADLVLPSKLTGMFASGRPVIVLAEPGTQIAAEVEGRGVIVPPGNGAALAAAIIDLADNDALRARLGHAARAAAETRWNMDRILQSFEKNLDASVRRQADGVYAEIRK